MQVADLATAAETGEKFKPWTQIDLASVSGNAPRVVFNHLVDTAPGVISCRFMPFGPCSAFCSVRRVVWLRCFRCRQGGPASANTAAALPLGESLAQTLILSLHPASPDHERLAELGAARAHRRRSKAALLLASGPTIAIPVRPGCAVSTRR